MKKLLSLSMLLILFISTHAQNVGIGTNTPLAALHIRRPMDTVLLQLENGASLDFKTSTGLYLRTGDFFTGAIKTIGTTPLSARLGFFTFADQNHTNLIERLSIADNGAVGIGTITPNQRLDVAGRMRLRHTPNNTAGIWLNKSDNTDASFIGQVNDTTFGVWDAPSSVWRFAFNHQSGRLGIGTTLPSAPLSFANTVGSKISFWGSNPAAQYGIGVQGSQLQLYADGAGSDIVFGHGGSNNLTETMRIKGNGNVGIGTNSPSARLHLTSSFRYTDGNEGNGKFLRSDNNGNASWAIPTRVDDMTIGNLSFESIDDLVPARREPAQNGTYVSQAISGAIYAPVYLPNGANITQIEFFFRDHVNANLTFEFNSSGMTDGSFYTYASYTTSGTTQGWRSGTINLAQPIVINNSTDAYYIQVHSNAWPGNSSLTVGGVRIRYNYRVLQ